MRCVKLKKIQFSFEGLRVKRGAGRKQIPCSSAGFAAFKSEMLGVFMETAVIRHAYYWLDMILPPPFVFPVKCPSSVLVCQVPLGSRRHTRSILVLNFLFLF